MSLIQVEIDYSKKLHTEKTKGNNIRICLFIPTVANSVSNSDNLSSFEQTIIIRDAFK